MFYFIMSFVFELLIVLCWLSWVLRFLYLPYWRILDLMAVLQLGVLYLMLILLSFGLGFGHGLDWSGADFHFFGFWLRCVGPQVPNVVYS